MNGVILSTGHNPLARGAAVPPSGLTLYEIVQGVVELILYLVLLIACIGALSLKGITYRLLMGWSVITLALTTFKLIVALVWTGPEAARMMQETQARMGGPPNPVASMGAAFITVSAFIGWGCC